jgi:hypothetical protein
MEQKTFAIGDCLGKVFAYCKDFNEALKGSEVALAQSFALGEDPLVIAGGKEILCVECDCRLQAGEIILAPLTLHLCDRQGVFKGCYIQPKGSISAPLQRSRSRLKELLTLRESMSERVEDMP